jgi:hypothetical protein
MKTLLAVLAVLVASPAVAGEFSTSVYFDTAKSSISAEAAKTLELVADKAKGEFVVRVDAVGSSDARKFNTNLKLAQTRADAVKKALVVLGVKAELIVTSAVGDAKAVKTKDLAALAKDRRVDITVISKDPVAHAHCIIAETREVVVEKTVVVEKVVEVEKASPWEIMAFGEFGVHKNSHGYPSPTDSRLHGKFNNWGSWQFGTEFHYKPVYLGLRTFAGNNGVGAIAQVFPVQGRLNWYIGPGISYTAYPFYAPVVPEVARFWDLQLWTGLEYAFTPHLIGLADLRASLPLPESKGTGPLTGKNVRDSLSQTAAFLGIGYRF